MPRDPSASIRVWAFTKGRSNGDVALRLAASFDAPSRRHPPLRTSPAIVHSTHPPLSPYHLSIPLHLPQPKSLHPNNRPLSHPCAPPTTTTITLRPFRQPPKLALLFHLHAPVPRHPSPRHTHTNHARSTQSTTTRPLWRRLVLSMFCMSVDMTDAIPVGDL